MPRLPIKHDFLFKLKYNNITRSNYIFRTYDIDSRYYSIMNTIFVHVLPRPHWRFLLLNPSLSCGFSPNGLFFSQQLLNSGWWVTATQPSSSAHKPAHLSMLCTSSTWDTLSDWSDVLRNFNWRADMYLGWEICQYILGTPLFRYGAEDVYLGVWAGTGCQGILRAGIYELLQLYLIHCMVYYLCQLVKPSF